MWSLIILAVLLISRTNSQSLTCMARAGIPLVGCDFQDYPIRGAPDTCQPPDTSAGESCYFIWKVEGGRINVDIYDENGCNQPRTPGGVWMTPGGACFSISTCQTDNAVMSISSAEFDKCAAAAALYANETKPALIKRDHFMN